MEIVRICGIDIEGSSLDHYIIIGESLRGIDTDISI